MKRICLCTMALLLVCVSLIAQQLPQDVWESASRAYNQEDYARATEQYQMLLPEFNRSAVLHHNLGNCYYRLGSIPRAILHYERSLKLRPLAQDTRNNLALARMAVEDRVTSLPGFFLVRWVRSASWILTPLLWGVLSLLALWSGVGLLIVQWLEWTGRKLRIPLAVAGALFVVSTCLGLVRYLDLHADNRGVVMESSMTLRAAPDGESAAVREIAGGEEVKILDSLENFYKVRLVNYEEGWIRVESVERI